MIYVSGRVDVSNIEHYRSQYEQAKEYLRIGMTGRSVYEDRDIFTLIQLYDDVKRTKDLSDYSMGEELDARIEIVKKCSRLYLLMGWEVDDMCRVESIVAKANGIPVTYSKKF
jgi:hypothetical protein